MTLAQTSPADEMPALLAGFFACAQDVALQIASASRDTSFPARAIIVSLGARCDHVHVVLSGRARARAISLEGRQAMLEEYGPGDMFGEGALLSMTEQELEIVALDLVRAAVLLAHVMLGLMSTHASVAMAVSRQMIARLSAQNHRLAASSTLSATGRVHAEILRMARERDDLMIGPPPVLSQLALRIQSTRETVSRTIAALQRRGIIQRDDQALRVVAEHRLEELIY